MIEMPMCQQHCIESAIRRRGRPIQRVGFLAALKQPAINKDTCLLGFNDVTRTGYFAASCANEGDLNRDGELMNFCRLKRARLLGFRPMNALSCDWLRLNQVPLQLARIAFPFP